MIIKITRQHQLSIKWMNNCDFSGLFSLVNMPRKQDFPIWPFQMVLNIRNMLQIMWQCRPESHHQAAAAETRENTAILLCTVCLSDAFCFLPLLLFLLPWRISARSAKTAEQFPQWPLIPTTPTPSALNSLPGQNSGLALFYSVCFVFCLKRNLVIKKMTKS